MGFVDAVLEEDREADGFLALQFRFQAGLFGHQGVFPGLQQVEGGLGHGIAHADQGLPGADVIAFTDQDFLHDAAFKMGNGFAVAFDPDRTEGNGGAFQFGGRRPDEAAAEEDSDQ